MNYIMQDRLVHASIGTAAAILAASLLGLAVEFGFAFGVLTTAVSLIVGYYAVRWRCDYWPGESMATAMLSGAITALAVIYIAARVLS